MIHRHLDYPPGTAVEEMGDAALDDLLDQWDLESWRPLARAIAADPFGELAQRILHLCDANPRYGASPLWRTWIARRRALAESARRPGTTLAETRRSLGLSQAELARRIGMSQSDLSKAERRTDWKLSTLRTIARGMGLEAHVVFVDEHGRRSGRITAESTGSS